MSMVFQKDQQVWACFKTWEGVGREWLRGTVEAEEVEGLIKVYTEAHGYPCRQWVNKDEIFTDEEYAKRVLTL